MTLPMTIRLACSTAKIGFVFSQRGVVMEAASSFFLPRLIGHSKALYLTTTGSVLPASSPHFGDLFAELLQHPGAVLPRALQLAEQITAQTSTISTYLMRELMWRGPGTAEGTHLLDSLVMVQLYDKKDKKEGMRAFLEKRPVKFGVAEGEDEKQGSGKTKIGFRDGLPECVPWWDTVETAPARQGNRTAKSVL